MKLNYRRTFLVGLAFLSIQAFWQMYDGITPKMLTETFKISETLSGGIMAMDNVLALFLLPLFGTLSDRCQTRIGRRMPFILSGTAAAVVLMMALPLLDNSYALSPAPWKLAAFVALLGLLLVAMGIYRSPAVALMPDVTPKPLRSQGNAIINLMGAAGGILYLLISGVLYSGKRIGNVEHVDYFLMFAVIAGIMVAAVLVLFLAVRENKLVQEAAQFEVEGTSQPSTVESKQALSPAVRRSLIFVLCSVALWYIGYNGITTWFTVFADKQWGMVLGDANMCLTIATAGAIVSYIPIGVISGKIGRKKTILIGCAILASCFGAAFVYSLFVSQFSPILYLIFILIGFAWAAINVNSLPMVVEMCHLSDVGKFTGYYYTFSMAAQIVTPIVAGALIEYVSYNMLFLYSTIFVAASFVTMLFVKHGDIVAPKKKSLLENFDVED